MPFTIGGEWFSSEDSKKEELKKNKGPVKVFKEKRKKAFVTCVRNLPLSDEELKAYAKKLKAHLACGGAVKDGVIELQGEHVEKVKAYLKQLKS